MLYSALMQVGDELSRVLSRSITGKLMTDSQIQRLSGTVVGKYFSDWFPTSAEELQAQKHVELAQQHIAEANRIITGLKGDLDQQAEQLDSLAREVEKKRRLAERYATLAATHHETFQAFRAEMEESLRRELAMQANKGKRIRQTASFIVWLLTLILGAALGAYFPQIVSAF